MSYSNILLSVLLNSVDILLHCSLKLTFIYLFFARSGGFAEFTIRKLKLQLHWFHSSEL